ncbi:MAG: Uncharacterised protein [Prochlorococcus marinus str. MIT 9313]|nr:MAG: Uncharacterised protein [Prochlorococcus marinus str. MIT 9313]
MWLWSEVTNRDLQVQSPKIPALLLQHLTGIGNAKHILIRFARQSDHEVELDLAKAVLHRRADPLQQVGVRQTFIDNVPQALTASLRREGETGLTSTANDVSDIIIKAIDPLAGQLKGHILIRQTISQLHTNRWQSQVIAATERQQRKIAISRSLHTIVHCFNHRLRINIPSWTCEHAGLAKTTTTSTTATNLHLESIMHRFNMWNQTHGVVRHRLGHPSQNLGRRSRLQRNDGGAIRALTVKRRHVNARHLS